MKKSMSSRLRCRIEVWASKRVKGPLGNTIEDVMVKKVWGEIKPVFGSSSGELGGTIKNSVNLTVNIRETEIDSSNWLVYRGVRYDISHIMPHFQLKGFLQLSVFEYRE